VNGLLAFTEQSRFVYKKVDNFPKGLKKTEGGKPSAFALLIKFMRQDNPDFMKVRKLVLTDKGR